MLIVSNNPEVKKNITSVEVAYCSIDYGGVLNKVKKMIIDDKYRLLTHPLSGSIKPNETYYKSILVSKDKQADEIDLVSLEYIEDAIAVYEKFIKDKSRADWSDKVMFDFATVDYYLIKGALESSNI